MLYPDNITKYVAHHYVFSYIVSTRPYDGGGGVFKGERKALLQIHICQLIYASVNISLLSDSKSFNSGAVLFSMC